MYENKFICRTTVLDRWSFEWTEGCHFPPVEHKCGQECHLVLGGWYGTQHRHSCTNPQGPATREARRRRQSGVWPVPQRGSQQGKTDLIRVCVLYLYHRCFSLPLDLQCRPPSDRLCCYCNSFSMRSQSKLWDTWSWTKGSKGRLQSLENWEEHHLHCRAGTESR